MSRHYDRPIKRADALQPLSRDHHQALFIAQRLRRADPAGAADAAEQFLVFWREHGRRHFRVEEEVLLPAYVRHGEAHDPAVVRVLTDHVTIRRIADDLAAAAGDPPPEALRELGVLLDAHVRHEERVLFGMIESALPADELAALAAAIEAAERGEPPAP